FPSFENHLQMRRAARLFGLTNFVEHPSVITCQKDPAIDHHIDFIRSVSDRGAHLFQFEFQRHQSGRKCCCHRSDLYSRLTEKLLSNADKVWIDAYRRAGWCLIMRVQRMHRLPTKERDLAG